MATLDDMPVPGLAPAFALTVAESATTMIGRLATGGVRRQRHYGSGAFTGGGITGALVAGSEMLLDRPDGVTVIEANHLVRTADGATIRLIGTGYTTNDGPFVGTRMTIVFEADEDGPHARLTTRAFAAECANGTDVLAIHEIVQETGAVQLEFALEIRMELGERMHIALAEGYTRGTVLIRGGAFTGPGLNGTLVEGSGGDFPLVRHDGGGRFESQYLLRTDDGAVILKRSAGVRHADPEVIRRLMAGEEVDPRAYYMRMTPRFEAPAGPYAWMNRTIFVGVGWRGPTGSLFRFWKVV